MWSPTPRSFAAYHCLGSDREADLVSECAAAFCRDPAKPSSDARHRSLARSEPPPPSRSRRPVSYVDIVSGPDMKSSTGDPFRLDPRRFAAEAERARAAGFALATELASALLPRLYDDTGSPTASPPSALVRDALAMGDQLADGLASVVRGVVGPLAEYAEAWLTSRVAARAPEYTTVECVASSGQTATTSTAFVVPCDVGPGRLWVTALAHPSGQRIEEHQIRCLPATFEHLAAGTTLPVRIVIDVPRDAAVGCYVGHLLCTVLSADARPVRLEVSAESAGS
jgi:hypothetical protein